MNWDFFYTNLSLIILEKLVRLKEGSLYKKTWTFTKYSKD